MTSTTNGFSSDEEIAQEEKIALSSIAHEEEIILSSIAQEEKINS